MSRLRPVDLRIADAIGASRVITLLAILLSMLLLTGCGGEEAPREQRPAGEGEEDVRPLSREQLEMLAEAMSPAVAESLGIVDTTIRVTSPIPPESVLLPGTAFDTVPEN